MEAYGGIVVEVHAFFPRLKREVCSHIHDPVTLPHRKEVPVIRISVLVKSRAYLDRVERRIICSSCRK